MGCGESKNAVATGNTISKSKSDKPNTDQVTNDIPAQPEQQQQQKAEESQNGDSTAAVQPQESQKAKENSIGGGYEAANVGSKGGDRKKEPEQDQWNGIDSVEAVISDGISGKTEFYSPKKEIENNGPVEPVKEREEAAAVPFPKPNEQAKGEEAVPTMVKVGVVPTIEPEAPATTTTETVPTVAKAEEAVPTIEPEGLATSTAVVPTTEPEAPATTTEAVPTIEPEAPATIIEAVEPEAPANAEVEKTPNADNTHSI